MEPTKNETNTESQSCKAGVMLSGYYVNPKGGECIIVLAQNIGEACDKLEKAGIEDYVFVHSKSFDVLH